MDSFHNFLFDDSLPDLERRRQNASAWFQSYQDFREILTEARDISDYTGPRAERHEITAPAFDRDANAISAGEIRMLSSALVSAFPLPRFVLVLGEWVPDYPLIVPFSLMSGPATSKELRTDLDDEDLSVLQIWNARSVPIDLLTESWSLGSAPDALVADASTLHRSARLGLGDIPADLLPRIGTTILHPDDPRREYLAAEMSLFAPLQRATRSWHNHGAHLMTKLEITEEAEADGTNIISFPIPALRPEDTKHLAAAASGDSILLGRVDRTFAEILAYTQSGESTNFLAHIENEKLTTAEVLEHPRVFSDNVLGTFYVEEDTPPCGTPFLLLDRQERSIHGRGQVDADGNLELKELSQRFAIPANASLSDCMLLLPER